MAGEITAAGAVVWRRGAREAPQIALVHRPRYDDWSLPKGKLERGESTREAAAREVAEETGFRVALGHHVGRTRYRVTRPEPATKVVEYYAARPLDGSFEPGDEVDELRWLAPDAAKELLSYDHDRRIVDAFTALPHDTTTLLLVRHAKAGSRASWDGPDDERPLSVNGRHQLPPIHTLCGLYGASRVHAAPLVRCVETVRAVAESLGVAVTEEQLLSEAGYTGNEDAALARLLDIAGAGGTPVVCSQGGVIPDLVSRVAGAAGLPVGELAAKKASVWALFFTCDDHADGGPRLVAADYIPRP
ncbi:MAG TPA: NUDIX domain-containing protein [Actinophytocola sp.]|jgi:8-oxo-dGTP diphosphatase|uniref:NUDIX hydrolase n=1 Tax=Actinophytocola sp. TaxID=1872138 RepID=UPI002F94AD43